MESWLIDWGRIETWAGVKKYVVNGKWDGQMANLICVDAGNDQWTVYGYCAEFPDVCRPIRGLSRATGLPYQASKIDRHPVTGQPFPGSMMLWGLNTAFFKDRILRLQMTEPGQPGEWHLPEDVSDDYVAQVTSERRVFQRHKKTGRGAYVWLPKYHGIANHMWDCEGYATAAAHMLGVGGPAAPARSHGKRQGEAKTPKGKQWSRRRGSSWMKR